MKNKKLLANTFHLYIISIVKMIFPLIVLPYFTRIFSVEIFGVVSYVKAYISYVQLLIDFGFLLSATKNIAINRNNKEMVGMCIGNTIVEKSLLAIFSSLVTFIAANTIPILTTNQWFVWLYFISCILTILIPDFLYRGIEKMEYAAVPFIISKGIVLILTFILIKSDADLLLIPMLEIIGNFTAGYISLLFLKKLGIKIYFNNFRTWIADIKESSVYFFSNFATTFFGSLTTIIVGIFMSKLDIAYWSLCIQIVTAAKAVYSPLVNSLYPHMMIKKDVKLVNKIAVMFCIPLAIGAITVILFGENIIELIGGVDYRYAGVILKYILPVLVASFFSMLYGWPILGAIGKAKETTISTLIAAIIQITSIGLLLLLNNFNLISLAVCCGISEVILFIIRFLIFYNNKILFYKEYKI